MTPWLLFCYGLSVALGFLLVGGVLLLLFAAYCALFAPTVGVKRP